VDFLLTQLINTVGQGLSPIVRERYIVAKLGYHLVRCPFALHSEALANAIVPEIIIFNMHWAPPLSFGKIAGTLHTDRTIAKRQENATTSKILSRRRP